MLLYILWTPLNTINLTYNWKAKETKDKIKTINMGLCNAKPATVYVVKENRKDICCTYDLKKAEEYFKEPRVLNRELVEYHPDGSDQTVYCVKHTYSYN